MSKEVGITEVLEICT